MGENAPSGREKLGEQHEKSVFEFLRHNFSWVSAFGISVFEVFRFSFFGFLGFHILNFAFLSEKGELQVKTEQFQGRRDGVRSRNHAFQGRNMGFGWQNGCISKVKHRIPRVNCQISRAKSCDLRGKTWFLRRIRRNLMLFEHILATMVDQCQNHDFSPIWQHGSIHSKNL